MLLPMTTVVVDATSLAAVARQSRDPHTDNMTLSASSTPRLSLVYARDCASAPPPHPLPSRLRQCDMSKAPAYGEEPPLQGFRRSFTAPPRQLSLHERAGLDKSDAEAGLVYQHPAVRIFSFAPPTESIVSKSSERHTDADYPIDTVETLPWRSRTEDLIATGPMRIEKIKGSVNFLKCGSNFVYSILRNSQCWCVDGESKFVLRKGRFKYYRLELPNASEQEQIKVEELKAALATILKFEKTPCPFKRAFQVDLPDDAITPRRKGKWTRRESDFVPSPDTDAAPPRKWKSSRPPTSYNGPPSAFPDSFNRRRASDYVTDMSTPLRPVQLERRRSVAERRAAFEGLHSPSHPSSRPRTPASIVSSEDSTHDECEDEKSERANQHNDSNEDVSPLGRPASSAIVSPKRKEIIHQAADTPAVEAEENNVVPDTIAQGHDMTPETTDHQSVDHSDPAIDQQEVDVHDLVSPFERPAQIDDNTSPVVNMARAISDGLLSQGMAILTISDVAEPDIKAVKNLTEESPDESKGELESKSAHFLDIPSPSLRPMGSVDTLYTRLLREVSTEPQPPDVTSDSQDDTESVVSTADSFHTVDTINEETSMIETDPTPLAESFDPLGAKRYTHKRDVSEVTVTASTFSGNDQTDGDRPGTPKLVQSTASDDSWSDVVTPSHDIQDGLRQRLRSRRSLSPLPPAETVVTRPPRGAATAQVAAAIIQKAAVLVVVKPIEVVALVVHVLARIAGGATLNDLLSGGLFQRPEQARRHHARNPSFPDHVVRGGDDDDDEDDFGVPIRGRVRGRDAPALPAKDQGEEVQKDRDTDVDSLFADDLD